MKFARTAIIIQPISDVGILLHLDQSDARADRMDGSCRDVKEIPRPHRFPVHQLLNLARKRRGTQFVSRHRLQCAHAEYCTGLCINDIPAFLLARRQAALLRLRIGRMHLNRELFRCKQPFDKDRQRRAIGSLIPDLANLAPPQITKGCGNIDAPPGLFHEMLVEFHDLRLTKIFRFCTAQTNARGLA